MRRVKVTPRAAVARVVENLDRHIVHGLDEDRMTIARRSVPHPGPSDLGRLTWLGQEAGVWVRRYSLERLHRALAGAINLCNAHTRGRLTFLLAVRDRSAIQPSAYQAIPAKQSFPT